MIRGTTPTHVFTLPFDTSEVKKVLVTYAQKQEVLFEKTTEECMLSEDKVLVSLTQEETFRFDCTHSGQVQIRVLTEEGKVFASVVKKIDVDTCLSKGVLE